MKLVILTGAPASGKSSIAEAVGAKLGIDVISKDGFKIELFEKYGFTNHAEKKKLSIEGEKIMNETIKNYVNHNVDLIVDNNFKNFNDIREILNQADVDVEIKCVYCIADYDVLAKRYNERISSGNRHLALYTLNQYPVIEEVSEFHPLITKDDVERIEQGIQEFTFGQDVLEINTDNIGFEFDALCNKVIEFIS
ncbi:AAA family ATPase [Anaerotignum lactatifermentans]|jgi:chloramphenicol phosphotransferase-like protein|uniref:AAA domain-containing protein n=1 Tax=Anaerotignum lactatifermentans DSM 14214 TaxID=1121323 RepID=A0A1M6RCE5_9FIRM|nr:AAA family ATPase [Anaerotignum lactatifermentans]SHK30018.1 AAA domain-containing protein [[Clostridium] lactatifermentans DSM 14214] [Anaerotignum lactatifermentans DSM 14214]